MHIHFATKNSCHRFLGEIVIRGAEAARHDHKIAARERSRHILTKACGVIPHHCLTVNADAESGKATGKIGRIGIHDIADQKLGADAKDLGTLKAIVIHNTPHFKMLLLL